MRRLEALDALSKFTPAAGPSSLPVDIAHLKIATDEFADAPTLERWQHVLDTRIAGLTLDALQPAPDSRRRCVCTLSLQECLTLVLTLLRTASPSSCTNFLVVL